MQAKAAAGTAPKDAGGALAFAIGLLDTTCDWPYQYYSDDQLTNIMSLAATKNMISPVSFSKRMVSTSLRRGGSAVVAAAALTARLPA